MSTKKTRSGGKFTGNHTTITPAAAIVADLAVKQGEVSKVAIGIIKAGLRSVNGNRRVKISDGQQCIHLSVRDNTTNQELFVYSDDHQKTKLAIARGARNNNLSISFGNQIAPP